MLNDSILPSSSIAESELKYSTGNHKNVTSVKTPNGNRQDVIIR